MTEGITALAKAATQSTYERMWASRPLFQRVQEILEKYPGLMTPRKLKKRNLYMDITCNIYNIFILSSMVMDLLYL